MKGDEVTPYIQESQFGSLTILGLDYAPRL